jgi:hypothetical protein
MSITQLPINNFERQIDNAKKGWQIKIIRKNKSENQDQHPENISDSNGVKENNHENCFSYA